MATTTVSIRQLFAPTSYPRSRFRIVALAKNDRTQKRKTKISTPGKGFDSDMDRRTSERVVPLEESELNTRNLKLNSAVEETEKSRSNQLIDESKYTPIQRGVVLKSCIGTSAALALAGFLVRQASHTAATNGWSVPDCTVLMPYSTELWHIIPTVSAVVLVSALRQILIRVWPDFAESSEVSNCRVLGNLKGVDYFTVAYLSGLSEELLFRGALLPVLGPDWRGVLGAGIIFGVLHISGGRKSAFGIWASCVGITYGILGLYTNDLATPMAAHSAANLLGAALWKYSKDSGSEGPKTL